MQPLKLQYNTGCASKNRVFSSDQNWPPFKVNGDVKGHALRFYASALLLSYCLEHQATLSESSGSLNPPAAFFDAPVDAEPKFCYAAAYHAYDD